MNVVSHEWTKQEHAYLKQLVEKSEKNEWGKFADDMTAQFGHPFTYEQVRSYWRTNIQHTPSALQHKEVREYKADGSAYVEDLVEIYNERDKTPERILEILGFDSKHWEYPNFKISKWNQHNKEDGTVDLYSVKADLKPKQIEVTPEDIAEIFKGIEPRKVPLLLDEVPKMYLLIPLYDMHFGLNSYEEYLIYLQKIKDIVMNGYAEILIIVGGDFLHVDNNLMMTEYGTRIDDVPIEKMKKDAARFVVELVNFCLEHSPKVKLTYLPGNHAPSNDHSLLYGMGVGNVFEDLEVDLSMDEMKHDWLGGHSIFSHHGDKYKKLEKVYEVITGKFPKEWGESISRYYVTGHLHTEYALVKSLLHAYRVMSPSKATTYDKKGGWDMTESGMMLFEFDDIKRRHVHYL